MLTITSVDTLPVYDTKEESIEHLRIAQEHFAFETSELKNMLYKNPV